MEQKKKFNPEQFGFDKKYSDKVESLTEELGMRWKASLLKEFNYHHPSLWNQVLSEIVSKEIEPSSKDAKSVRVYAILTDRTKEAMYEHMVIIGK